MPTDDTADSITIRVDAGTEETITLDRAVWRELRTSAAEHDQSVGERLSVILDRVIESEQ